MSQSKKICFTNLGFQIEEDTDEDEIIHPDNTLSVDVIYFELKTYLNNHNLSIGDKFLLSDLQEYVESKYNF